MAKISRSKWRKYTVMRESNTVAKYLPKTASLREESLAAYIHRYRSVIVKPNGGSGGAGVIKITRTSGNSYVLIERRKKINYSSISSLTKGLKKRIRKFSGYVVQQYIPLASVGGRPFDIRVMLQRRKGSSWKITGELAKVAGKGYFVTNIALSKGKVLPLRTAIVKSNMRGKHPSSVHSSIRKVALATANQLSRHYNIKITGLDVGIDQKGKVWIIEANFTPSKTLFLKLKDKTMYRNIVKFKH